MAGIGRGGAVFFPDELRLGLRGSVRRVLAPKGVKVVQRVQLEYGWRYLLPAVDPVRGRLRWAWFLRMNAGHLRPVLRQRKLRVGIWDGAPAHKAKAMDALETVRIRQPAYSPELDPAERIFEEVRRHTEGRLYDSLEAKQRAAEGYLRHLHANPARVKRLCGWNWIQHALDTLPPPLNPLP